MTNNLLDDFQFRLTSNGPKTNLLRNMEVGLYNLQGLKEHTLMGSKG